MDNVRQLALASHFNRATLKTAERLAGQRHAWRKPLAWFQPDAGRADALQGEVALEDGVFCATAYLYPLLGQLQLDTTCTCGHVRCAHAAALLVRLQQLLDWPRAMTALERWQSALHELPDAPAAPSPPWSFACLLQPSAPEKGRLPRLLGRPVAYQQQDAAGRPLHGTSAEKARAHLDPSSHAWLARLLATQRRQRASNASHHVLEGENGAHLLDEMLRAGVCRHAGTLQR
ncbi:MAG: hypothetical protein LBV56_18695 [Delftia acidovorans]|nr:hypothetical protein [Delftia acidovorans]